MIDTEGPPMLLLLARYATTAVFAFVGLLLLLDPATRKWARDEDAW